MAFVQFYSNLPSGFRLKDLFVPAATPISLSQNLSPAFASFTAQLSKGWLPVTYYGQSLTLDSGSVSSVVFGPDAAPWLSYGSAADPTTRFTYTGGLAAFQGSGASAAAIIMAGSDEVIGSANGDYLDGYAGDDTLDGAAGSDTLVGGLGDDTYLVDNAWDRIIEYFGGGRDTVVASTHFTLPEEMEIEFLRAASGTASLSLTGNSAANVVIGNDGSNTLAGGGGLDTLEGGFGNDTYVIGDARSLITERAGEGIDTILASVHYALMDGSAVENLKATGSGSLRLTGNDLQNILTGNDAANVLNGMAGDDTIYGGKGKDLLQGGLGNDALYGGDGLDRLYGEDGNDILYSGSENGMLSGGAGNDVLYGYWNDDLLVGDSGNDKLYGHTGNDTLRGGDGNDVLVSGEGYDRFVFDTLLSATNVDTLKDFNPWADQIRLKLSVFGRLGKKGALSSDKFWMGPKAHDSSDRIIYNKKIGALFYDPDGTGHIKQMKFAIVGKVDLSASAFLIF